MATALKCSYKKDVDISTDDYDVTLGDLRNGFRLTTRNLNGGNEILFGKPLRVTAYWAVDAIPDIKFVLRSCVIRYLTGESGLSTAQKGIPILLDGCYATVFDAKPVQSQPNSMAVQFIPFIYDGGKQQRQNIDCTLRLCMHNCPYKMQECPKGDQFDAFQFQPFEIQT